MYEWEIENFSCWNAEIHGDVIAYGSARLYPRGEGGKGECLELRLPPWFIDGSAALEVIASDRSVICTLSQKGWDSDGFCIFPGGPRFSEVVSRIKEKEHLHKDRLILRWTETSLPSFEHFRSLICVFDASVELNSRFFCDLEIGQWNQVTVIHGPCSFVCYVYACKSDTGIPKFQLNLSATSDEIKLLVRTIFTIPKAEGNTKIFEEDFLLVGNKERIFSFLQPEKAANEKIFLTLKFIGKFEHFHYSSDYPRTQEITNPGSSKSPENVVSCNPSTLVSEQAVNAVIVLTKELACLYQDHDFSDFELRCKTVSFPTHRNILSARSPVFKAMLSGDMKEAGSGQVDVEDLDPHTLGRFLAFLYSGATGGEALGWEEAIKLYYAADKYQVPTLKEECASVLCASVSLENVCDILSLADKHQDEELILVAHDFILKKYNEVLGSEKWEELIKSNSILAVRTLTRLAKSGLVTEKLAGNRRVGESLPKRLKKHA